MGSYDVLAKFYDELSDDMDQNAWADYIARQLSERGVGKGARVLECCCGTGGIAIRLSRAGFDVTASDISENMLERARENIRKAGRRIPVVLRDMRDIELPKKANAIIAPCDGVNYLTDSESVRKFFRSAKKNLAAGGVLAFDVSSESKLRGMAGEFYAEDRGDVAYIWQNELRGSVLEMELTFFERRQDGLYIRRDESHRQRAHTERELTGALSESGFTDISVYAFGTTESPTPDSERLQFVAKSSEKDG